MKVLVMSTSLLGGAGGAAYRVHQGLLNAGVDSRVLVRDKQEQDTLVQESHRSRSLLWKERMYRLLNSSPNERPLRMYPHWQKDKHFSIQACEDTVAAYVEAYQPDIINLHWVCGGWMQIETLASFGCPVVWTLQDMWPMTGGCHHSEGCDGFQRQCGRCPHLGSDDSHDLSRQVWQRKDRAWRDLNLTITAGSTWICERAKTSSLFGHRPVQRIPLGIDTELFSPVDKTAARKVLRLPADKKIILFNAWLTNHPWKGLDLLQEALVALHRQGKTRDYHLIIFGMDRPHLHEDFPVDTQYLGPLRDSVSLAAVNAAGDVLAAPSRQDNYPASVMEALACGTPAVAFEIGGMPDMINHQENGILAPPYDSDELARGIDWVLSDPDRLAELSRAARRKAEADHDMLQAGQSYRELFERILSGQDVGSNAGEAPASLAVHAD